MTNTQPTPEEQPQTSTNDPYNRPRPILDGGHVGDEGTRPQPGGWSNGVGVPGQTNTLSVVSLVSSIASFVVLPIVGAVVGVIAGHIALRQIKQTGENGRQLALWGTIVGYVHLGLGLLTAAAFIIFFVVVAGLGIAGAHSAVNQQQNLYQQCEQQARDTTLPFTPECQRLYDSSNR